MQIGPRQHEIAAGIIAVIRLMHVPEENQIDGFFIKLQNENVFKSTEAANLLSEHFR